VEIQELHTKLLRGGRNDIAFTVDGKLVVFIEHQSTINPNMPLRLLQYVVMFYSMYSKLGQALYKNALIRIPYPEFYVLYLGKEAYPPEAMLKLSDAFELNSKSPNLELVVNVRNIRIDLLTPALRGNPEIHGFATFVNKVNVGMSEGLAQSQSIRRAVNECIREGILGEFLAKNRNEVESMFSLVYDERIAEAVAREEGREEGRQEGLSTGIARLIELINAGVDPNEAARRILQETEK
jgi:predicted transposase YdaD